LRREGVSSVSLVVLKVRLAARLMAGHGGGTVIGLFTVPPAGKVSPGGVRLPRCFVPGQDGSSRLAGPAGPARRHGRHGRRRHAGHGHDRG